MLELPPSHYHTLWWILATKRSGVVNSPPLSFGRLCRGLPSSPGQWEAVATAPTGNSITNVKQLRNVIRLVTSFASWGRDVASVDPNLLTDFDSDDFDDYDDWLEFSLCVDRSKVFSLSRTRYEDGRLIPHT